MKSAVLAALLCLSAVGLFCQPKGSPAKNEKTAAQGTPTPAAPDSDRKSATETESTKRSSPHWYASSEWWLVWIATLTGLAIFYQAREMTRATEVMQRQVTLQELGMQQWLEMDGWRIQRQSPSQGNPSRFEIATEIKNVTANPLTVQSLTASIAGREFRFSADNVLPPNGGFVTAEFPITLTPEEITRFADYKLNMPISGYVAYVDYFEKSKSHPFGFNILCGPGNFFRLSSLRENSPTEKKQGQYPN